MIIEQEVLMFDEVLDIYHQERECVFYTEEEYNSYQAALAEYLMER
jgi:hypothetical protein